ncbi:MAG: aminotransferase class V-fold PLP-dependent enzyme, partial [Bacilli bacterium]|nr:aminotransferase class V-fold PLP-dependent enzyme [Bacilli bacterium]
MIYLDYSATTPTNKEVLDTFVKVSNDFICNPYSLHKLVIESKKIIYSAKEQIKKILN